jgi:hypothetical protein
MARESKLLASPSSVSTALRVSIQPPFKLLPGVSESRCRQPAGHIGHAQACLGAGTRMGYRASEMPGGGRDGWRRGWSWTCAVDPSSRARYTGRNKKTGIKTQKKMLHIQYLTRVCFQCSGMHAKSMQKIAGSKLVCTILESRSELVCTGMYWYVLVCTCM